jgi:hypothetical protein
MFIHAIPGGKLGGLTYEHLLQFQLCPASIVDSDGLA